MTKRIQCPYCFEKFRIDFYPEEGQSQELIYDCEICCHPIEIKAYWDAENEKMVLDVQKSTGFN